VELAAARTKLLPPVQLLGRLEQALPLLTAGRRDAPERQRTLRATIAWSFHLLTPHEQDLFRRLSVFAGSFDLTAAERICDAELDTLQSLLEKNLVRRWESGRFGMLETIHEYAGGRLEESGDAERVRDRHAAYFLELAESAGLAADVDLPQRHDLVIPEASNLRAALDWAGSTGRLELAARLAVALENFWVTNNPVEGMRRIEALLREPDDLPPLLRARTLRASASCTFLLGERDVAQRTLEESLAIFRDLGDDHGIAVILHRLAVAAMVRGEREQAAALGEESLALHRASGSRKGEAQALALLGSLAWEQGHRERALELLAESAELARAVGFRWWEAGMLVQIAWHNLELRRPDEAARAARDALSIRKGIGDRPGTVLVLAVAAGAAAVAGRWTTAGRLWGAVEAERARGEAVVGWQPEDDAFFAELIIDRAGSGFEDARAAGRSLAFEAAVEEAEEALAAH
ncbi:MAG: tetratricopeptide repeat protein, partial [Thermoleophilia bacterium]|nr:tetratricopeptide repeat protein [Thermoleophilia bacterium]